MAGGGVRSKDDSEVFFAQSDCMNFYGFKFFSPKRYVKVLTLSPSESDLIRKQCLCRCN